MEDGRVRAVHVTERQREFLRFGEAAHPAELGAVFTAGFVHVGREPGLQRADRVRDEPVFVRLDHEGFRPPGDGLLPSEPLQAPERFLIPDFRPARLVLRHDPRDLEEVRAAAHGAQQMLRMDHLPGPDLNDAESFHGQNFRMTGPFAAR